MIRDLALLALAQSLLRFLPPLRAHAVLLRVGALLPELRTADEVRRALSHISGHGTCLGRAMAVAARTPTADVVIGVDRHAPEESPARRRLFAHAWIEMSGAPVDPLDAMGAPIARIRGPRST